MPNTSTYALTNATLPYAVEVAGRGVRAAMESDPSLAAGLNTAGGRIVNAAVASALGEVAHPLDVRLLDA